MPVSLAGLKQVSATPAVSGRCSIPLVGDHPVSITNADLLRIEAVAARLIADEPALSSTHAFGVGVEPRMLDGPTFFIGHHHEIALAAQAPAEICEYRIAALAAPGDIVLSRGNRNPVFANHAPRRELNLLFDASHNTCKTEFHPINSKK